MNAKEIMQAMTTKIREATYERISLGVTPDYPKFIYLGGLEYEAYLAVRAHASLLQSALDAAGKPQTFEGVTVLRVMYAESHLEVSWE